MVLVFAGGNRDYGLMGISYWNVFTRRPVRVCAVLSGNYGARTCTRDFVCASCPVCLDHLSYPLGNLATDDRVYTPLCAHLWLAICLAEITLFYSDNSAQEIASNSRLRRADLHCVGNCWRGWIVGRLWHACPCRSWFIIGAGWLAFLVGALAIAKSH